jgi:hypothetical protein
MTDQVGNAHVYYQSISPGRVGLVQTLCDAMMAFPHLRLGQLIFNALDCYTVPENTHMGRDIFYTPDDIMKSALKNYIEEYSGPGIVEKAADAGAETPYAKNRQGQLERIRNFSLNVMDWQLYSGMPESKDVAELLNMSLKYACEVFPSWEQAQDYVRRVMGHNMCVRCGAGDTEPDVALCEFLAVHYKCETYR